MKKFSEYNKRILVAVSGLTPAILTETLYAVAVNADEPFIPTEVHLLTTLEGKERAQNSLLKGEKAAFKTLCQEYGLLGVEFLPENIHVITDKNDQPLADIRYPKDNETAADFIVEKIRELTLDEDSAVHVSIAGGRKTMGYYVGYALSLFGREQDRLSHVLVEPDYERCMDFFYPTKSTVIAVNNDKKPLDLSEGKVYLAEIPFVRMRSQLPENVRKKDALINGRRSFSEVVRLAQSTQTVQSLYIDPANKIVRANDIEFTWSAGPTNLAFYIWAIIKSVEEKEKLKWEHNIDSRINTEYGESFADVYQTFFGERSVKPEKDQDNGMSYQVFAEKKSRVNSELKSFFGETLGGLLEIKMDKESGSSLHYVDIPEDKINIVEDNFGY